MSIFRVLRLYYPSLLRFLPPSFSRSIFKSLLLLSTTTFYFPHLLSRSQPIFYRVSFSLPMARQSLFPTFQSAFLFHSSFFCILLLYRSLPHYLPTTFRVNPIFLSTGKSTFSVPSRMGTLIPPSKSSTVVFSNILFIFLLPRSTCLHRSPIYPIFISLYPKFPSPRPIL